MWSRTPSILNYAFALLVVAVTFVCVTVLDRILEAVPPVSLFLCAIVFVAWFAGLGAALLASAVSVLAAGYFYLIPINSLTQASQEFPRIVVFGVAAVFIASISAAERRENVERKLAERRTREAQAELQSTIDMVPAPFRVLAVHRPRYAGLSGILCGRS